MADYVVPRHSAVMERLRRRIELFRRHHSSCEGRYDSTALERLELERQHTFALHQRCLQSKAKRSSKHRQAPPAVPEQGGPAGAGAAAAEGSESAPGGEHSRSSTLIALQDTVKRKLENAGSPGGEANGFGEVYPSSKQSCLEESRGGVNGVPPTSPLESKLGVNGEALQSNGKCQQGAEQKGSALHPMARAQDSDLRLREMKQEPVDDFLPCVLPPGGTVGNNNLLPDLNLNEQEWRELMAEFDYDDIEDIFNEGFDERRDPLPQTPAPPDPVNIKAEFSPASVAFDQEPRRASPQVRPTSCGPPLRVNSPITSTAPSPALSASQTTRQLSQNLPLPGPPSTDLSPAQQLQQLAAREQQRAQLMQTQQQQQQQQQQQAAKFHTSNHQANQQAPWTQPTPSQSQLASAYSLEKQTNPALYQQDFSSSKPLTSNLLNKSSPKAGAGSYQQGGGHTVLNQAPLLDYASTRPLSHFQANTGPRGPTATPLNTPTQNKAALLSLLRQQAKQKAGMPFRPPLPLAQDQSSYQSAPHMQGPANAMAAQSQSNSMAAGHGNASYLGGPAVSLEQQKSFHLGQRQHLLAQQEKRQQLQRHLTRPPPQYQDQQNQQNSQNPFQQQDVSQFPGSSQQMSGMGPLGGPNPGGQRMFPQTQNMMGVGVGQSGGPTSVAPSATGLADMGLPSCGGGGLDNVQQALYSNMHSLPSQPAVVNSAPLQRQPSTAMTTGYRQNLLAQQHAKGQPSSALLKQQQQQQHLARMPTSMPNAMANGMVNTMPSTNPTSVPSAISSSLPTSMPSSIPNAMPTAMPSSMPSAMTNAMPNAMSGSLTNPMSSPLPTSLQNSMSTQSQSWQPHPSMQQTLGQQAAAGNGGMQTFSSSAYHMQPRLPKLPSSTPFSQASLNNGRPHATMSSTQVMGSLPQSRTNMALGSQPLRPLAPPHRALAPAPQKQQLLPGMNGPVPDMAAFGQVQGSQVGSHTNLQCSQSYQVNRTANHELPFGYNDQSGSSLPSFPEESDLMDSLLKSHSSQEWMDELDKLLAGHQ